MIYKIDTGFHLSSSPPGDTGAEIQTKADEKPKATNVKNFKLNRALQYCQWHFSVQKTFFESRGTNEDIFGLMRLLKRKITQETIRQFKEN